MNTTNTIIQNLDAFIRKYYKNNLIKGLLYSLAMLLSLFIIIVMLEYFGYFGTVTRALLFWFYILSGSLVVGCYIVVPLLKMFKLSKGLSYEEAADIIGKHFPEVQDKLLNLLQLQGNISSSEDELLQAAIKQKTLQLTPVPFLKAVDLKANLKYVKYVALPFAIILIVFFLSPTLITEPSKRIAHYNTHFERPAPFSFVVENSSLEIPQQEDFELLVSIEGDAVPNEAFLVVEGNIFKMKALDKTHYSYLFKNVQRSVNFHFQASDFSSSQYELRVIPKPAIIDFRVLLSYPSYIGKPNEVLSNIGDITVPQGTVLKWIFQTKDVDTLVFSYDELQKYCFPNENGVTEVQLKAMKSFNYAFYVNNKYSSNSDTLSYSVLTIEDASPLIVVAEMHDSVYQDRLFFKGSIKDDYGFSKLVFKYVLYNDSDPSRKKDVVTELSLKKDLIQDFFFTTNLAELTLSPGDKLEYYFEVWDNDEIHGPKSSTSQHFEIEVPTEKELDNILERNLESAKHQAETSMSELKKLQDEINKLMSQLVDKKDLNWSDKKQLEALSMKQHQVKDMLTKMQLQIQENNHLEQRYKEQNQQIMEKQKELDRLFNEVLNDEMKEMMKEIDKLLQETDKKKVQEQLENIKFNNEELEKQLDQNIDLMKRLEMEKKVDQTVKKMQQLAEEQMELSKKTEQSKSQDKQELMNEQKHLSDQFQEMKKDIESIKNDYHQIDRDIDFKANEELQKDIEKNQQSSENKINKGDKKEAAKSQKQAAEDMQKLADEMEQSQQDIEQSDLAEDSEMIRRLLKNLVQLSFNQEDLINKVNHTYIQDPLYQSIIVEQNKIKEDFRNVEDSLRSVAKRQINVAAIISKDVTAVHNNLSRSLSSLLEMNQSFYGNSRNTASSRSMQYTMTSFNNLALMMAESLDNMQNKMRQNQSNKGQCKNNGMKMKSGNCPNPGKGKPSAKSIKQMQDELNKQMEALKKQLDKQGGLSGQRKKIGDKGSSSMSQEFAKMAAQQEMIRRMMQQYGDELKLKNAGNSKLAKQVDELLKQIEQTENDLVNKTITQQTISRQKQIMTRLLEHEKAEMEREKEEKRKSIEGKEQIHQLSPAELERFERLKDKNFDIIRNVPPTLSNYYKNKVDRYFFKF